MKRWESIRPLLDSFQRRYCHLGMPRLDLLAASDKTWTDEEYQARRPTGFPGSLFGVYLLFDHAEQLQYVGAAMSSYDKRVWSHDRDFDRRYVDIVPLDATWYVLTLALEFFLIQSLAPPQNRAFRGYKVTLPGDHEPIPNVPKSADG